MRLITLFFLLFLTGCATTFNQRTDVQQYVQQLFVEYQLDRAQLTEWFSHFKPNPKVIALMKKPKESLTWAQYRALFVTDQRARDGAAFWRSHAKILSLANQNYHVPPEMIVAILGVETNYGAQKGSFNALGTLATLAFNYPPRANYFRSELTQFLLLSREVPFDPMTVTGSYAGALGMPQFMPSSYRSYAVSATGSGHGDLFQNTDDAILSVANYFHAKGWQAGGKVAQPLTKASAKKSAKVLTLTGANGPEYWQVFHNFDVIKRYNTSSLYAMAAYQLSQKIKYLYATSPSKEKSPRSGE